jgi:multisubunit Na+/H+ antiporter MnhG subunit
LSLFTEIAHIKSDRHELRKFGLVFGTGLFILSLLIYAIHRHFSPLFLWQIPLVSILLGLTIPVLLWPFQKIWMIFGLILGFVMTRILLGLVFFIVLTPIGLIAKIAGKEFLNRKIETGAATYWNTRDQAAKTPEDYEKQF